MNFIISALTLISVAHSSPIAGNLDIVGDRSSLADDAQSKAVCPTGYVVSHCEVQSGLVHTRSDGAYVDPSNGRDCVAVNGAGGPGAIARAVCSRSEQVTDPCNSDGPDLPKFINLHSRGPAPGVSCPPGYQQVLCNARSPWLGLLTNKGVNTKGIISSEKVCAVSRCSTSNWCEVTAVCRINEDPEEYKVDVCPKSDVVESVGLMSGSWDDAQSRAVCPTGYVVSHCEVQSGLVHTRSDGAYVDPSNSRDCVAVNGAGGPGAIARAVCSRSEQVTDPCNSDGPDLPKFINLHSRGPAPGVSCPPGYQQVLCNARSPWLGLLTYKGVNTNGIIPNDRKCAVSGCSTSNWCEITAVCRINEDPEEYKVDVCSKSDVVVSMGLMSGSWDDAQSRAVCPTGYVVSYCEVQSGLVHTRSDGAYVDPSNGRDCVAVNGAGGPGAIARAVCSRSEQVTDPCNSDGPDLPKFINLHSRGPAPGVSCPPGYQQVLCNARSPWLGLLTNKGVNTKGIISSEKVCAVSRCSTSNWCEVTAVCRINEDPEEYKVDVCPKSDVVESVGLMSGSWDDAQSRAVCPTGYVVSHCEVQSGLVHTRSDGAYVDPSNSRDCVAVNGAGGPGAIARAVCSRSEQVTDPCNSDGPDLPKFINLHSRGPAPGVSCPPGYQQVLCNARSPWLGLLTYKGVNTNGIIPNDRKCAVSGCSTSNWCEITAVCRINEDPEEYKVDVCSKSDVVVSMGLMSGSWDDAQSRAVCPTGYVVSHCEVQSGLVHTRSDGAYVDPSNGSVCVAVNGAGGPGAIARAVCSRSEQVTDPCNSDGPDLPKFINLHSRGPAPGVSCPPGYQQVLCNARSPWLGLLTYKGVNTNGIIPNDRKCAVSGCSTSNWCEITAVCRINEDPEEYKVDVCSKSDVVVSMGLMSGSWDDAQSRAVCPTGYVVSHCEVQSGLVHTRSDGAYVDPSNGSVCVAVNGAGGPGAIARAVCSRSEQVTDPCNSDGPDLPKFINLHSRGPAPGVSCPPGYQQVLCNARSPWLGLLTNKGVNTKGIIPNDRKCAVSGCSTSNWCEVTTVCRINEDPEEYKVDVCSKSDVVVSVGLMSGSWDDARSRAVCPTGYVVSHCEVQSGLVHTRSDGAYVDPSNGRDCVAVNGAGGPGAIARAVCSRSEQVTDPCNSDGPDLPKFINLHSRGPAPGVSCPPGYQQVLCNARSPWLGLLTNKGVNTKGIISSEKVCAVSRCSTSNWCEVTAVCRINEDPEEYKVDVCPKSDVVESVGLMSGSWDDAQSRAVCPTGYVVSHCEVQSGLVHTRSDGAYVDPSNGSVCVAVNGAGGPGAIARAVCSRSEQVTDPCNSDGPDLPKFINLHSRGPAPGVSCPPGYQQVLCNARSPWLGLLTNKGVNTKGIIPNDRRCAVSGCSTRNWCEVTAVCAAINDLKVYKVAKCPRYFVEGGWSEFGDWSSCSAKCGTGIMTRKRYCNNPAPSVGGKSCEGNEEETRECQADRACSVQDSKHR